MKQIDVTEILHPSENMKLSNKPPICVIVTPADYEENLRIARERFFMQQFEFLRLK